jgi:probable selenium-dependent hydroxylase accessory protein YqeC
VSDLLDILEARSGIVCAVGAGGKKTTLYQLAAANPGRVGITSTVPIAHFPPTLAAYVVIADAAAVVQAVVEAGARHQRVAFALPEVKKGRYGGLAGQLICQIHRAAAFDCLLVKADGARMRWVKAPEDSEPLIPHAAATVLPLVSARAIGETLTEQIAHRPSRVEAIAGARVGDTLSATHVARLLASPEGALKNTGRAVVVPIINMVDDDRLRGVAEQAAGQALDLTDRFERVVLTSSKRRNFLVDVISR